jgi:hypothetical protein
LDHLHLLLQRRVEPLQVHGESTKLGRINNGFGHGDLRRGVREWAPAAVDTHRT